MNMNKLTNIYDEELLKSRMRAENEIHPLIDGEIYLYISLQNEGDNNPSL